jgi:hypothetical protein
MERRKLSIQNAGTMAACRSQPDISPICVATAGLSGVPERGNPRATENHLGKR